MRAADRSKEAYDHPKNTTRIFLTSGKESVTISGERYLVPIKRNHPRIRAEDTIVDVKQCDDTYSSLEIIRTRGIRGHVQQE